MVGRSRLLVVSRRVVDQWLARALPGCSSSALSGQAAAAAGTAHSVRGLHTTTPALARTTPPPAYREIGLVTPPSDKDAAYHPGQLFVHRLFGYKGIVLCSFKTKLVEKKEGTETVKSEEMQYQVLIHKDDWPSMGFPVDITAYLAESGGYSARGEKTFTTMNGVDCVPHADMVPFAGTERAPILHDLFDRIFIASEVAAEQAQETGVAVPRFVIRDEIRPFYLGSTRSWMAPCHVNRETHEGVEITVTTFYLGTTVVDGQMKHMWRYVIRLNNLTGESVIVRERHLKVYSLNSMHQLNGHGVIGRQPELSPARPAFQFSSSVDLAQSKGGHMWGSFKMERENGQTFDVPIPTFQLDAPVTEAPLPSPLSPSPPSPPTAGKQE